MTEKQQIALIVDDEPDILELLDITLSRMGLATRAASDLASAFQALQEEEFDLCLTDMRLPDGNGIELVRHIQKQYANTPIAMITAHGNMESAIEALKSGAFDFVSKPVDLSVLRNLVNTALKLSRKGPDTVTETNNSDRLLGDSEQIRKTREKIHKLARSQAPVYIHGESGVGKELVARMIHELGPRRDRAFVPVNCGAIPAELMESEFFGHKKGSFTGAVSDKAGLFKAADGGTLFLDEVADLPLDMQVKLLRAIQEKAIRPIGSQEEIPVNVRILSATHKNLSELSEQGEFRQDLYYRINVIELHVPSLRERPEDIRILTRHFLQQIAEEWQLEIPHIDDETMQALIHYPFPGNVRELLNILERAMTLSENSTITIDDLQLPEHGDTTMHEPELHGLEPALQEQERQAIIAALKKTRYNRTAAAKLLGLTLRQLRYRIQKLGIE